MSILTNATFTHSFGDQDIDTACKGVVKLRFPKTAASNGALKWICYIRSIDIGAHISFR